MALESESLTKLRGIAQALGLRLDWGWSRGDLIKKIEAKTTQTVNPIPVSTPPQNEDPRLRIVPPARNLSQHDVWDALREFRDDRGLIVTFPSSETIYLRKGKVEDSCSLRVPLRTIIDVAKKVLYDADRTRA